MAKVGTAHVEIKPVLNEEALDGITKRIEDAVRDATMRGTRRANTQRSTPEIIADLAEEPQAMTLSHDRLILQRAERDGGRVVVVRCPHTIGLCFEVDYPEPGFLGLLPCPCNDRSEIIARVIDV